VVLFTCVDVADQITVTVANELNLLPFVVAVEVQSTSNISQYPFHRCPLLSGGVLHEPTDVSHRVCQIWSGVHQIAQGTNIVVIMC
jgi:hypothetical protein